MQVIVAIGAFIFGIADASVWADEKALSALGFACFWFLFGIYEILEIEKEQNERAY